MAFFDDIKGIFFRERAGEQIRQKETSWITAASSEASPAHPDRNEDRSFVDAEQGIVGVADGVSGGSEGRGGERASQAAVDALHKWSANRAGSIRNAQDARVGLTQAIHSIDTQVRSLSTERGDASNRELPRSTIVVGKVVEAQLGTYDAAVVRVGNSRAYVHRADGKLERVHFSLPEEKSGNTKVHDTFELLLHEGRANENEALLVDQASSMEQLAERWAQEAIRDGTMTREDAEAYLENMDDNAPGLSASAKENFRRMRKLFRLVHENKNASQYMSTLGDTAVKKVSIESAVVTGLKPGERLIFVSDGVAEVLPEMDMEELLNSANSMQEGTQKMIEESRRRMGTKESFRASNDDATSTGIEIPGGAPRKVSPVVLSSSRESRMKTAHNLRNARDNAKWASFSPEQDENMSTVEIASEVELAQAQYEYYQARERTEEVSQIVQHEGMNEYWQSRLETLQRKLSEKLQKLDSVRVAIRNKREQAQQKKDEIRIQEVQEKIESITSTSG